MGLIHLQTRKGTDQLSNSHLMTINSMAALLASVKHPELTSSLDTGTNGRCHLYSDTYHLQAWLQCPGPELLMSIVYLLHVAKHIVVAILRGNRILSSLHHLTLPLLHLLTTPPSTHHLTSYTHSLYSHNPSLFRFLTSLRTFAFRISSKHLINT